MMGVIISLQTDLHRPLQLAIGFMNIPDGIDEELPFN